MRDILKCMSGPKDDSNQSDKNRQKEGAETMFEAPPPLRKDSKRGLASKSWTCDL